MSSSNRIYTVYQIKNLVNSKVYIGITTKKNPIDRWNRHLYYHTRRKSKLYSAMRKHGPENFEFFILEQTNDIKHLKELEAKYIQEYNSYCFQEVSCGYNMTLGGDGTFGRKHTEEAKMKMSKTKSETPKTHSDEFKENLSKLFRGKPKSEEHRRKLSEAAKRRYLNPEERAKMSELMKGSNNPMYGKTGPNNPFYGKTHSNESRQKISDGVRQHLRNKKTHTEI